jgi:serine/threonine protein kinase
MDLVLSWGELTNRKVQKFVGPATIVVGRSTGCEVSIDDSRVSRRHCSLRIEHDGVFLSDLGSANGTLVNGRRCGNARLAEGDLIGVGSTELRVKLAASGSTDRVTSRRGTGNVRASLGDGEMVEVPGYEFLQCLGMGAFGAVYEALDAKGNPVALKVVKLSDAVAPEERGRFVREFATAASLVHPNVVRVLDQGQASASIFFLSMELIEGESVAEKLRKSGRFEVTRALEVVRGIASALEAARVAGFVHRDVKPGNILLGTDGSVKLTDFGLAKSFLTAGRSGLTRQGDLVGSIAYMAPEQLENAVFADHRADLHALGATLYEMLTLRRPYKATSYPDYMSELESGEPVPIEVHRPDVPRPVRMLVERCLKKRPEERPQTAGEILRVLSVLLASPNERTTHAEA